MKKLIILFILLFTGIMVHAQSTRVIESNLTLKKTTPTFYLQGSGANINFNNDLSLTQSINKLTLSGGNFDLGSNNLLITGGIGNSIDRVSSIYVTGLTAVNYYSNLGASSIGTMADRILKGWFTSIEISTVPTISGVAMPVANWNTAYTDRLKWDGGNTDLIAADGRTSLGATTVGSAFFTLTNPTAITFPRINADNTVTALSAANFKTAIAIGQTDVAALPDSLLVRYTKTQADLRFGNVYSMTTSLTAGVEADVTLTGVTSEPYALWIIDSDGLNITEAVKDSTAISGGVYHTYIYSVDAKTDIKIKVLW